jgi:amidohydrolase
MHACGHDLHMAILLGTEVLASLKKRIKRYSKVYISTSRRRCPEGEGGAALMVKEGVLENPKVIYFGFLVTQCSRRSWQN